eukprot:GHVQ01036496.1.p3 GENE.GHVQ01036496.1~~GHVQ01036496.1.p3  ORF type:complete len:110 (-),score=13.30 GHVQ01036496.1:2591-2920(-)
MLYIYVAQSFSTVLDWDLCSSDALRRSPTTFLHSKCASPSYTRTHAHTHTAHDTQQCSPVPATLVSYCAKAIPYACGNPSDETIPSTVLHPSTVPHVNVDTARSRHKST